MPSRPFEPEPVIDCIDCGGRAHLLSKPDDFGWEAGQVVAYRCEDCMDRWDLVLLDEGAPEAGPPDAW